MRVPTQITCQTFKEHPRALGLGQGPGSIRQPMLDRMLGPQPGGPRRVAAGAARGAEYSPDRGVVNARVWRVSGAQPMLAGARTGVRIPGRRSGSAPGPTFKG